MKLRNLILLLALLPIAGAPAQKKPKKSQVSAVFENARYVYVQAQDGSEFRPGLFPEDRQAIADVEDGLRDWNRYTLTTERNRAELVFVIRKGRLAGAQAGTNVGIGPQRPQQNGPPGQGPVQDPRQPDPSDSLGARTEVGSDEDALQVYMADSDGHLKAQIWQEVMPDGLDAPGVPLLRHLREAVERAYPPPPPKKP
ncbi:MAG TPA: hypothetical protein VK716_03020 [Terracidiphilus sp.]|jgi:hypothetical protein|nr:hypothetical protein [Terracidiphilus sp.]